MSSYPALDIALRDILSSIQPSSHDRLVRQRVVDDLRAVVQSLETRGGLSVEPVPFGSFLSNLFTRSGDLDISLELRNGLYISSVERNHEISLLEAALNALRRAGGWHKLELISQARVPILKLESWHHNISCDISINNFKGLIKSKFFLWISEVDGRFRELVLLVKEWAKAHDINDPRAGSLSSYSLTLLVIFHFQTCEPAILPPLKEIYPRNIADELSGTLHVVERRIKEICEQNIATYKSDRRRRVNQNSLSELLISFLAKFSDIRLKASTQCICPFTGKWVGRIPWRRTVAIFIKDPFEHLENAGRAVRHRQLRRISEVFATTHRKLGYPYQSSDSIVDTLINRRPPGSTTNLDLWFRNMSMKDSPSTSTRSIAFDPFGADTL